MYGLGDAMYNGLQGYRQGEQDNGIREDRDYLRGKRESDDARQEVLRGREDEAYARKGVMQGREDQAYESEQSRKSRIKALRETWDAYAHSKVTGDLSKLKGYMQQYDNKEEADILDVQYGGEGKIKLLFDDESEHVIDEEQFKEALKMQFSPENWMKIEQEKDMLGARTQATKEVNTHAAGLKAPQVVETQKGNNGLRVQDIYQGGKKIGSTESLDPAYLKAMKSGSGKSQPERQIEADKFFASLAAKQFGSPDASGNIMLDEKGGQMKSKVETIASGMFRQYGDARTPLQYFAMALKMTRDNPALTKNQAVKKLKEQGIDSPGFWASDEEREEYEQEIQDKINESESIPGVNGLAVKPPAAGVNTGAPASSVESNGLGINPQSKTPTPQKNIITTEVPKSYADKMVVGKTYIAPVPPYKDKRIIKSEDGTIHLIE